MKKSVLESVQCHFNTSVVVRRISGSVLVQRACLKSTAPESQVVSLPGFQRHVISTV